MIDEILLKKMPLKECDRILVKDLCNLLSDDYTVGMILSEGYKIIYYHDVDIYRYQYETSYRGKSEKLLLLVNEECYIPWDIKQDYFILEVSLGDVFENLDVEVLKEIEREYYDVIYEKSSKLKQKLDFDETCAFILKSIFQVDAALISSLGDLVKNLLKLYYKGMELPPVLRRYIKKSLDNVNEKDIVEKILKGKEAFFDFLQEQWEVFLESFVEDSRKPIVDFEDPDIRVYIDNLFKEGYLNPIRFEYKTGMPEFVKAGIIVDYKEAVRKEHDEAVRKIEERIENIKGYKDWLEIAKVFGEIIYLSCLLDLEEYRLLSDRINEKFKNWLLENYGKLPFMSFTSSPVMVHHVQHYIVNLLRREEKDRVVLIVFDGMSEFNWCIIKNFLKERSFLLEDKACFAWIPTITSVSRQALFSGEIPVNFKDTLFSTDYDEKRFKKFYVEHGYKESEVAYLRGIKTFKEEALLESLRSGTKIIGVVADIIDIYGHQEFFDYKGFYQRIEVFLKNGFLAEFLEEAGKSSYEIFITSDHGNISTVGQGSVKEGVVLDTLSNRIAVYQAKYGDFGDLLREKQVIEWKGDGLPKEFKYLICDGNYSFIKDGESAISHGGIALEEVVVPFARIIN
ncbi:BREX-3 system phosphatase PglZ [Thermovorax subterraneus]|nr:BREX-3 system phosphatase PglZ [Thermovorax subterraneus]